MFSENLSQEEVGIAEQTDPSCTMRGAERRRRTEFEKKKVREVEKNVLV